MLTSRGIEVNPNKCSAVLNMQSPRTIKEVQQLTGRIASLTRFLPDSARKYLPFFSTLRRKEDFQWNAECEEAFQELKKILSAPPILSRPDPRQTLYLYLAVTNEAINAALVKEESRNQSPIYFVSKALQGSELNYQRLEKVTYTLLLASRRLRPYF
jgi:hypothetical protein